MQKTRGEKIGEECCREAFVEECCREVLETSVRDKCCRKVLEKRVGEECCSGEALEREVMEKSIGQFASEKSGGEKGWRRVL